MAVVVCEVWGPSGRAWGGRGTHCTPRDVHCTRCASHLIQLLLPPADLIRAPRIRTSLPPSVQGDLSASALEAGLVNDHIRVLFGEVWRLITGAFYCNSPWPLFAALAGLATVGVEVEATFGCVPQKRPPPSVLAAPCSLRPGAGALRMHACMLFKGLVHSGAPAVDSPSVRSLGACSPRAASMYA